MGNQKEKGKGSPSSAPPPVEFFLLSPFSNCLGITGAMLLLSPNKRRKHQIPVIPPFHLSSYIITFLLHLQVWFTSGWSSWAPFDHISIHGCALLPYLTIPNTLPALFCGFPPFPPFLETLMVLLGSLIREKWVSFLYWKCHYLPSSSLSPRRKLSLFSSRGPRDYVVKEILLPPSSLLTCYVSHLLAKRTGASAFDDEMKK